MTKRKTFDVQMFRNYVNERLSSNLLNNDEKHTLVRCLEHVLQETGNYKGFRYIYKDNERPCVDNPVDGKVCNPSWTFGHELNRSYF